MLGPKVHCHYTESFISTVLFTTVNKLQVTVQTVGVFWVNTNGIMLTTKAVKVSFVVHKFKKHTNICTTRDKISLDLEEEKELEMQLG